MSKLLLYAHTREKLELTLEKWRDAQENNGLRLSRKKTEYMFLRFNEDPAIGPHNTIRLDTEPLNMVESFTYLSSVLNNVGKCDKTVNHRVQAGWLKWRSISGVLCEKGCPSN